MKIVILDGHALNPGDLSYDAFKEFGELIFYPRTAPEQTLERIIDADAVLLNKVNLTREILSKCKKLKYIGVFATGYNVVDCQAAKDLGIVVTNIPSYSTMAVAQSTFAFIFEFYNRIALHNESVMSGEWIKSLDFCYWKMPLTEIFGKTIGLVGFGSIGQRVAKIATSFGMKVLVHTRSPEKVALYNQALQGAVSEEFARNFVEGAVTAVSFEQLLNQSDIVSLHCPLTSENKGFINQSSIEKMKDGALLINTARGALIDEVALRKALDSGKLSGYGADVLSTEPMDKDCPLFGAPNCIITPHIAWAAKETRERLLEIAIENFKAFLAGKIQNRVN